MKKVFIVILILFISLIIILSFIKVKEFLTTSSNAINRQTYNNFKPQTNTLNEHSNIDNPSFINSNNSSANINKNRISIIIDDTGNTLDNIEEYFSLAKKYNITFSILPDSPYAYKIASLAHENNITVMLHMPMESEVSFGEKTVIKTFMDKDVIFSLLDHAFSNVPYAEGLNNHTGSVATKDKKTISYVVEYLKDNNKYFLDSVTGAKSVVYDTALLNGVKTAKRDIFLDNEHDYNKISSQWDKLINIAKENGYAIAIGHYQSKETFAFFNNKLPNLEKDDIVTVSIKDLLN